MSESGPLLLGRQIDQIGLVVPSVEQALAVHLALWPGADWNVWDYGPETVREVIYRGAAVSAWWRAAINTATPQLELLEPIRGPSAFSDWVSEHGYGVHHLGVFVDSLEASVAEMTAAGFEVVQTGVGFGLDGDGAFALFDSTARLGFELEAIVRPARRREPRATFTTDAGLTSR